MNAQLITALKATPQYTKLIKAIGKKLEPTLQFKKVNGSNYFRKEASPVECLRITTPALPNFSVDVQLPMLYDLKTVAPYDFNEVEKAWGYLKEHYPMIPNYVFDSKKQRIKTKLPNYTSTLVVIGLDGDYLYVAIQGCLLFYTPFKSKALGTFQLREKKAERLEVSSPLKGFDGLREQHQKRVNELNIPIDKELRGFLQVCVPKLSVDLTAIATRSFTIGTFSQLGQDGCTIKKVVPIANPIDDLKFGLGLGYALFKPSSLTLNETAKPNENNYKHSLGGFFNETSGWFEMPYTNTVTTEGN